MRVAVQVACERIGNVPPTQQNINILLIDHAVEVEIDQQDVYILLGWWDIPNPLAGDLNGDTQTNAEDLGMLLARWGLVP